MSTMSAPLLFLSAGGASDPISPQVVAAIITGAATIIGAALTQFAGKGGKQGAPQQEIHATYNIHNYSQPQSTPNLPDSATRRRTPLALAVLALGTVVVLALLLPSTLSASSNSPATTAALAPATTTPTTTNPPTTSQPTTSQPTTSQSSPSQPPPLATQVEGFLTDYWAAIEGDRTPAMFNSYWSFPADFYGTKNLPDVYALIGIVPAQIPTADRKCHLAAPRVLQLQETGQTIIVRSVVPWTMSKSTRHGLLEVNYGLDRAMEGQPFRIRKVSEPSNQPPAC